MDVMVQKRVFCEAGGVVLIIFARTWHCGCAECERPRSTIERCARRDGMQAVGARGFCGCERFVSYLNR